MKHASDLSANSSLYREVTMRWPGFTATYYWLPPEDAIGVATPNQVEVVFSQHVNAAFTLRQSPRQMNVVPGATFIVGSDPITWWHVRESNEVVKLYPDLGFLQQVAQPTNARRIELETDATVRDAVLLGIAHVVKRALAGGYPISHRVAQHLLGSYCGIVLPDSVVPGTLLSHAALRQVCDYIEAHLSSSITLGQLAELVHLSPFHFARCFKATLGLAPHQYVLARRIERAKRLVIDTQLPVAAIAWSIGYENISHFRRVFAQHTGHTPGDIRRALGRA
jgi:AraC family transcriptional regulator